MGTTRGFVMVVAVLGTLGLACTGSSSNPDGSDGKGDRLGDGVRLDAPKTSTDGNAAAERPIDLTPDAAPDEAPDVAPVDMPAADGPVDAPAPGTDAPIQPDVAPVPDASPMVDLAPDRAETTADASLDQKDAATDVFEAPSEPVNACAGAAVGATCAGGHCCGGQCVANDIHACGATCSVCQGGAHSTATCNSGVCGLACDDGFGDCLPGTAGCETDIRIDKDHCGTCTHACVAGTGATVSCAARACVFGCSAGRADCDDGAKHDGSDANGCESPLSATTSCGACGVTCGARANTTASCAAAGATFACAYACTPGFDNCDGNAANGCETNLKTDNLNCGKCQTKVAVTSDISNPDNWCAAGLSDTTGTCKLWLNDRCVGGHCTNCDVDFSGTPTTAAYCTDNPGTLCVLDGATDGPPIACDGCAGGGCQTAFTCPP